jgi:hypothetical protein
LARRLIDLGADVSNRTLAAIKRYFPELTSLHQFLTESAIPDCKEPEA